MSTPVFTKQDVNHARDPLVRLLRIIFFRCGITHDIFNRRHYDYFQRERLDEKTLTTHRNNLRRRLAETDKLTFRAFRFVLTDILRKDIERIRVDLKDRATGELTTYDSTEIVGMEPAQVQAICDKLVAVELKDRVTGTQEVMALSDSAADGWWPTA
jgi:hypothetical protein